MHRKLSFYLIISIFTLLPALASGHESPVERDLMVQCGAREVVLLLQHREPAGERVTLLLQAYDLDRDGQLTGLEAQRAAAKWLPYMLAGLRFEVPGEAPAAQEPSLKFQVDESGALVTRAMIVYELPDAAA